jgi:hypothetical protein
MPLKAQSRIPCLMGFAMLWLLAALPALAQNASFFPPESFTPINTTLPNEKLNFDNDDEESCCSKDYTPDGKPVAKTSGKNDSSVTATMQPTGTPQSDFEKSNPRYVENSTPVHLTTCDRFADLPENAVLFNQFPSMEASSSRSNLPIVSYSTNVSNRVGADYFTDPRSSNTSDFHIETAGGGSLIRLQDVNSYSVCMARGSNLAMIANTDNGSILTYNGNDRVYLSGNNTNMFTRTGAGEDVIEIHLTHPMEDGRAYQAFNIYKTAVSGGSGEDELIIRNAPVGTKWCHIGGYKIYGEYFYVVELALPPSVTEGPRRQRISIGQSVEYVTIKGKKYQLQDFLNHGSPVDTIAQSVPLDAPLPRH